ncbi:MAG: pyruvate, water dikinase [Pseudonocardiales bacterium]|jgi:pyruvate,water dikinase|nr:pyruvate, water dikinase [Pseudonocardiales bacterium]
MSAACAPLVDALDPSAYGPKAVQLGAAIRAGLPVPDGFAIEYSVVGAVGAGDAEATCGLAAELTVRCGDWPYWAVRSSAVGEDSAGASFAGIHKSILGVSGVPDILDAVREVHASASESGAVAYRDRMGLDTALHIGVVVQRLVDSDVGGVMFTRNPITGADERVIEASWGLGEVVVSGMVTPDRYVLDALGTLLEHQVGEKDIAIRRVPAGGTTEQPVPSEHVYAPCLAEPDLAALHALARQCDSAFGATDHDIEFAIKAGCLSLLQRRPITSA